MPEYDVEIDCHSKYADFIGARVIGLSATGQAEEVFGQSRIRFTANGIGTLEEHLFDVLSDAYQQSQRFKISIADVTDLEDCMVRECSLDPFGGNIHLEIFTPLPAKDLRLQVSSCKQRCKG